MRETEGSIFREAFFDRSCRKLGLFLVLIFLSLLTSCFDLKVDIQLNAISAGTIQVEAFLYRISEGLQLKDEDTLVPSLPDTKEGWSKLLASVPGSSLVSFASRSEALGTAITVVASFSNAQALERLFSLFRQKASLTLNGKTWNLTLAWLTPRFTQMNQRGKDLWNILWGEKEWTIVLSAPRTIRLLAGNGQVDGNQAIWRMKLSALTAPIPPPEWKLSW